MKVSASSFDVNLENLLDRMNHNSAKTYSGKIIQQTRRKLEKLQNNINNTISQTEKEFNGKNSDLARIVDGNYKDVNKTMLKNYNDLSNAQKKNVIKLTDLANGNHQDAVNQINQTWGIMKGTTITIGNQKIKINNASDILRASHLEGKLIADDMTKQIQAVDQARKAMMDNEIAPYVQGQFNNALNNLPATNTYYYPNNNSWPQMPQAGDLCWKSDWDDASGNYVNAKLYEYYNGQGWIQKKTGDPSIYAANINGASLKGGMITGATYESAERGPSGHARFSVDSSGAIYASNFRTDLAHVINGDQLNACVYYGYLNRNDNKAGGLRLTNGILSMTASVAQSSGMYNWDYQNHMRGQSFLEPGYLKLRYLGDLGYVRTDLRAGFLEIAADSWNQNAGARLGYLDGPNGQSSATLWLDGWRMYEAQDGSDALTFRNEMNKGQIRFNGPINVIGDLAVDNHVKIKGRDVGRRFEKSEQRLSGHDQRLGRHRAELDNHDGRIKNNENKLQSHENWLFSHNDQFDQTKRKLNDFTATLSSDGDTLTKHGHLLDAHGNELSTHTYKIGKHGDLLTKHGNKLSDHERRLLSHKSRLDTDDGTLQTHQQWLQKHDNLFNQHGTKLDSFSKDLASKGDTLTKQGQLIGQNGTAISSHTYTLGQHGELLTEHGNKLSQHDQDILDKQSQLNEHKQSIDTLSGTTLRIQEGSHGDAAFYDTNNHGHFTFHSDLSIVDGSTLTFSFNDESTQLWKNAMFTQDLRCAYINIGSGQGMDSGLQLTSGGAALYIGGDGQEGKIAATRGWVRNFHQNHKNDGGIPSYYATQSWVQSQGYSTRHVYEKSTIIGWINDAIADQTCDADDVDNEIRSMVKHRYLQ